MGDIHAYSLDHTGGFNPRNARQRQGFVETAAHIGVVKIDPENRLAQASFTRPRRTDIDIGDAQFFRATVTFQDDGLCHRRSPQMHQG